MVSNNDTFRELDEKAERIHTMMRFMNSHRFFTYQDSFQKNSTLTLHNITPFLNY
jgi:hypothetical protein